MAARSVLAYGPSWELLPPLVLAVASLVGAYCSLIRIRADVEIARAKADQELRFAEDRHKTGAGGRVD
jgi:hypothetical protein